jgi:hypothetical protein
MKYYLVKDQTLKELVVHATGPGVIVLSEPSEAKRVERIEQPASFYKAETKARMNRVADFLKGKDWVALSEIRKTIPGAWSAVRFGASKGRVEINRKDKQIYVRAR